jgi:hypothetical protein
MEYGNKVFKGVKAERIAHGSRFVKIRTEATIIAFVILGILLAIMASPANADEQKPTANGQAATPDKRLQPPIKSNEAATNAAAEQPSAAGQPAPWKNHWFVFAGLANLHARIWESEKLINNEENGTLGRLIPGWRRPHTFKPWSENFKLWDSHTGVGRDLGPKFSWFVDVGVVAGVVKNDQEYWPLDVRSRFMRRVWFLAGGIDYYPFGKPDLLSATGKSALIRSLKATRPYLEAAMGYVHAREAARVKFGLKDSLTFANIDQEFLRDVGYASPRIGAEIPMTAKDSLKLQAGYLFFKPHSNEFDNWSYYLLYVHKF